MTFLEKLPWFLKHLLANLIQAGQEQPFSIVHLATRAAFNEGEIDQSYIHLWGSDRISVNQIRTFGWDDPPVKLLVLSACNTAKGNETTELGFALLFLYLSFSATTEMGTKLPWKK